MITKPSAKTYGLVAQNTVAYVEQALACMSAGNIVVPLHASDDRHRIEVAGVEEVLGASNGVGWMSPRLELRQDDSVAQILFTSGTEGEPKGVVLTHRNLTDVVVRLNAAMQVTSDIREYLGVPVYHSFGFGRCRAVAAVGGSIYLPAQGFNPIEIGRMLDAEEINALSAVPSLWRVLLEANTVSKRAGARVRWIEIGSQYMSRAEKLAVRELFPNARIIQHYGLTEASRSTFLSVHDVDGEELESVGTPFGDVELRIGPDGRVGIRGPHVTQLLLTTGERRDPRDTDGWLTTSDLGELRDGYLHYGGRADDVINCGGLKLPPDALEERMRRTLAQPGEFSVCRVPDPVRGDGILIAATPGFRGGDAELVNAAVDAASAFNVNARGAIRILRIEQLPRTATGKVQRKELTRLYTSTLPEKVDADSLTLASASATNDRTSLRHEFCRILGISEIRAQDNFSDLGGDSLRFIQAGMAIQRYLGYLPEGWEHMPFGTLEALPRRSVARVTLEPSVVARAVGITAIVVNHSEILAGITRIDGAAFMLVIPMGFSFARFQLQRVLASDRPWPALSALPRIMVPTFLVALAHQVKGHTIYPSVLLFYNNFIDHYTDGGFNFWFIEVFVQLQLILFAICAIPWFRKSVRASPYWISLGMFVTGFVISRLAPLFWNTDHLFNLVPQRFFWYLALGWCIFFARARWQKLLNTSLTLFVAGMQLPSLNEALWVLFGGLIMSWAPEVRLPKAVAVVIGSIASASLYIYLTHIMAFGAAMALPLPFMSFLQIPIALVVGVVFGLFVDWAWSKGRRLLPRARAVAST